MEKEKLMYLRIQHNDPKNWYTGIAGSVKNGTR
jgi:hypothetical protein